MSHTNGNARNVFFLTRFFALFRFLRCFVYLFSRMLKQYVFFRFFVSSKTLLSQRFAHFGLSLALVITH